MKLTYSSFARKIITLSSLVLASSVIVACSEHGHDTADDHHDQSVESDNAVVHHDAEKDAHHGTDKNADAHEQNSKGDHGEAGHHDEGDNSIGVPGVVADITRTIDISMNDQMRFVPASINVTAGETIKFNLKNVGAIQHEMVIGNSEYLMEHSEMMKKFPGMEHEEPNMLMLEAAKSGELVWKFTQAGKIDFACLQPGHYDAGMKGAVTVAGH